MKDKIKLKKIDWYILIAISAFFLAISISSAYYHPIYSDEPNHLAAGYSKLKLFDYRMNSEVPPLINVMSALPLLSLNLKSYNESQNWIIKNMPAYSCEVVYKNNESAEKIIFYGRLPMVIASLILGLLIFFIIAKLYGNMTAHIIYAIYATHPMIIANATTIFVDFGFAFFNFLTFYAIIKFIDTKKYKYMYAFIVLFSLTMLTKFTAIHNFLFYPILILINYNKIKTWVLKNKKQLIKLAISALLIFYIILIVAYGFQHLFEPLKTTFLGDGQISKENPKYIAANKLFEENKIANFLASIPNPLPYYFIKGLGHWVFDSKTTQDLKFESLPSLFQKNTETIIILLLISTTLLFFKNKNENQKFYEKNILAYILFYVVVFNLLGQYNHPRHVLMVYPLLVMLCAKSVYAILNSQMEKHTKIILLASLVGLHIITSIITYPNFHLHESIFSQILGHSIEDMPVTEVPLFC